jgi:hypothetical protein
MGVSETQHRRSARAVFFGMGDVPGRDIAGIRISGLQIVAIGQRDCDASLCSYLPAAAGGKFILPMACRSRYL